MLLVNLDFRFTIESMIKIETVLDILKKDDLFREIIDQGHAYTTTTTQLFLIASVTTAEK